MSPGRLHDEARREAFTDGHNAPSGSPRHLAFISYSHTEARWCQYLKDALDPYVRDGHLRVWSDQYVPVGATWRREIDQALMQTRVAVLLVSAQFEQSAFISEKELPALLDAANAGHVTVVAVPVSASTASEGPGVGLMKHLADYQWVRSPRSPLDRLSRAKRTAELVRIARTIAEAFGPAPSRSGEPASSPAARTAPPLARDLAALHDVPPIPADLIERSVSYQRLKEEVLAHGMVGLTGRVVSVGVQGLAGVGKTVLAQTLAHDADIRRSFPDGIYWLTVGQRSDLWSLQVSLLQKLDPAAAPATLVEARALLKQRLEGQRVLLVLDDVWDVAQALAFDLVSAQSGVLITTREAAVIRALGAVEHALDVFSRHESLAFLAQRSGVTPLPPEAEFVADAAGDLPLALAIAAGAVRDGRSWEEIRRQLEDARITYNEHPFRQVFQALAASVNWLPPGDAARYLELAVFPDDEPVAETVVQRYWARTAGLDAGACGPLLERLHDKNLLSLTGPPGARILGFHDLQLQFLRLQADDPEVLHRAFLEANRPRSDVPGLAPPAWSEVPDSETYLWRHMADHLQQAGATAELRALLLDPAWIEAKLRAVGIEGLLATYVPFAADPIVSKVAASLRLASHALIPNPGEVRSQLFGRLRLQHGEEIEGTLTKRPTQDGSRWLRPLSPTLTASGAALRSIFVGHTSGILGVAVTPDGTRAISASYRTLRVWDLASGRALHILEGHTEQIEAVAVTSDGTRAVSASRDKTLRVWDLASGRTLHILEGHTDILVGLALTADGTRAASTEAYGAVRLWDLVNGLALHAFDRALPRDTGAGWGMVGQSTVVLTSDGTRVIQAGDGTFRVWDVASGRALCSVGDCPGDFTALAVTPDGTRAVCGTSNCQVQVRDLADGRVLHTLEGHTREITAVVVTPDGTSVVSGSNDSTLRVWDLADGHRLHALEGHLDGIRVLAVTPDGRYAISAAGDKTLRVWDLESGRALSTFEGHSEAVTAVAVTPDGTRVVSGSGDGTLRLWDLVDGGASQSDARPHTGEVRRLTAASDGRRVISEAADRTLLVWDVESGRILRSLEGADLHWVPPKITAVAVTPDGTRAVSATAPSRLQVWDVASGQVLHALREHTHLVTAVAVAGDGRLAVSSSIYDETLRVWDLVKGRNVLTLEDFRATILALTPDGTLAVSAYRSMLRVWDLTRGRLLNTKEEHSGDVTALVVTPDGTRVVSAGQEKTLFVWDLWSRHPLHRLEGHTWWVSSVAVTPDSARAVSASSDATLRIWDLATGRVLHVLEGHRHAVEAVALSPDGSWAVSASRDATVRVWDLERGSCFGSFTGDSPMTCCVAAGQRSVVAGAADGRVHILRIEGEAPRALR